MSWAQLWPKKGYTQGGGLHNTLASKHQGVNTRGREGRHVGEEEEVKPERQERARSQETLQAMLRSLDFIFKVMGSH